MDHRSYNTGFDISIWQWVGQHSRSRCHASCRNNANKPWLLLPSSIMLVFPLESPKVQSATPFHGILTDTSAGPGTTETLPRVYRRQMAMGGGNGGVTLKASHLMSASQRKNNYRQTPNSGDTDGGMWAFNATDRCDLRTRTDQKTVPMTQLSPGYDCLWMDIDWEEQGFDGDMKGWQQIIPRIF